MNDNQASKYSLFSGKMLLDSMRSGGYKNTAYAIAELVDNAVEAKARHVEILCRNRADLLDGRVGGLEQIAVLDDGNGMNPETLRRSLRFGDGSRPPMSTGIGKFGMGLPNSSLSQCKKIEAYSWQNSSTPRYICIELDEILKSSSIIEVPKPKLQKVPKIWKKASGHFSEKSGTLIIWSELDRCSWSTSRSIMKNSEFLIGRIYRRFLADGRAKIIMTSFASYKDEISDKHPSQMLPNDPLYLMKHSSTPGEWGKKPMFKLDDNGEKSFPIHFQKKIHKVKVRYAIVENEVRSSHSDAGHAPHGKHARKNSGISIMRADREIDLDTSLIMTESPERWWGVEVEFPTSLDSALGLTNNKQHMTVFSELTSLLSDLVVEHGEVVIEEELKLLDPTRQELFKMIQDILSRIRSMRRRLDAGVRGKRTSTKPGGSIRKAGMVISDGVKKNQLGTADGQRKEMAKEQRIDVLAATYEDDGMDHEAAKKQARKAVEIDQKIDFVNSELQGYQFFDVLSVGGIIKIKINTKHPASKNLLELTDSAYKKDMSLERRLQLSREGLELLLASWARFEDLKINEDKKRELQQHRMDWGRYLFDFLRANES